MRPLVGTPGRFSIGGAGTRPSAHTGPSPAFCRAASETVALSPRGLEGGQSCPPAPGARAQRHGHASIWKTPSEPAPVEDTVHASV